MAARLARRARRAERRERIDFRGPASLIPRTSITVQEARDGAFLGSEIPHIPRTADGISHPETVALRTTHAGSGPW